MDEPFMEPETQNLLEFAGEEVLVRTIMSLTPAQRKSHLFKQLGEKRYLSALRSGGIDNAEMTKQTFQMDPYFLKSKVVLDAAKAGMHMQTMLEHPDIAEKIKKLMNIPDETAPEVVDKAA